MARKNPSISKATPPRADGIEIPITTGVQQDALKDAEGMPEVDMKANDGGNPSISSNVNFANGKDTRSFTNRGPSNSPTPAMPGAN